MNYLGHKGNIFYLDFRISKRRLLTLKLLEFL